MNLSNGIVSFIDALGVVQGLLFGTMLILLHSRKNKPTRFLGVFIILFALEPISNVLNDTGILVRYPEWELFPVGFHFLAYPLLYVYIQKISIFGNKRPIYWPLIPGAIEFITALVVFFLPIETKIEIKESSFSVLYLFSGLCYSLFIAYYILKQINTHIQEVESQYTSVHHKTLNWSKWFTYSSIILYILILINFFLNNHLWHLLITLLNVVLIYWVSFKGITQENITTLIWGGNTSAALEEPIPFIKHSKRTSPSATALNLTAQTSQSLMTPDEAQETFQTVESFVKNSQCYTHSKLTIIDVAEATNIHPKRISFAINSIKSINFNNYINFFRVELAKELLKSEKTKNLSVEGIGFEAGFHSKTTFYSAFRKFENMTPAQYRSS